MGLDSDRSFGPSQLCRLFEDQLDGHCAPLGRHLQAKSDDLSRERYKHAHRIVSNLIAQGIDEIAQIFVLSSYHHVLKSKWLEGKRNRRVDHLVHTLVTVMIPSYAIHHVRQELGFEGLNLADKRRKELLARTPEINASCICTLGDDQFKVQSATISSRIYLVNLSTESCDCPDWPRIQLCKHVAAVAHFFGNGHRQIDVKVPPCARPIRDGSANAETSAAQVCATDILENVIAVSKALLSDGELLSPETVRSLQMVESHLTSIVHCSPSSESPSESPLPEKENIPPNQGNTWTETATRMGAKRQRRRPRPATASSSEPPEPSATELIGELNRKKARVRITDPYSGGVSSGRDAPPDARTAAQNAEGRCRVAGSAGDLALSQSSKRGRKHARSPVQPSAPSHSAPAPPSAPAWYRFPTAYQPAMYAHTPYTAGAMYWPYGHFPPPQPYLPPPQ